VRDVNSALDEGRFREGNRAGAMKVLEAFDQIFDVLRPSHESHELDDAGVERYIAERTAAKKARDFARADEIRALLHDKGIVIEDTRDGIRWKRK